MMISTKRCVIRFFSEEDVYSFMTYHNNLEWMQYQGFKGLTEQEYRDQLLAPLPFSDGRQLAIIDHTTQELIGDIYLKQESDCFWLGYSIAPKFSRQGYAFEAIQAIITYLKTNNCQTIKAGVLPENKASIKLLKKLGFSNVLTTEEEQVYVLNL